MVALSVLQVPLRQPDERDLPPERFLTGLRFAVNGLWAASGPGGPTGSGGCNCSRRICDFHQLVLRSIIAGPSELEVNISARIVVVEGECPSAGELRQILSAMRQGVISIDRSGTVVFLNGAAEELTGWSAADVVGQAIEDVLVLLDSASGEKKAMPHASAEGAGAFGSGVVLRARNGIVRSVAGNITPMRDREGELSGAVIVLGKDEPDLARTPADSVAQEEEDGLSVSGFKVVASSLEMKTVLRFARRVSESEASTILIEGESGTGKDVIANYMHHFGNRRNGPFVSLNCAAIPENLIESELFGYEKGAFTDARAPKAGILEVASGGTIFLDEIGEMPVQLQAKLLRVLEEHRFRRLGGTRDIHVNLRFMAATNRTLVEAIDQGKFRLDLYYRLNVIQICIPPLRDRPGDILPLARYFQQIYASRFRRVFRGLSPEAEAALLAYQWPGNVRELRNTMERATLLEETDRIAVPSLQLVVRGVPAPKAEPAAPMTPDASPAVSMLEQTERSMLAQALQKAYWNQTKAAVALGISRDALRYKIKKFGLKPNLGHARSQSA